MTISTTPRPIRVWTYDDAYRLMKAHPEMNYSYVPDDEALLKIKPRDDVRYIFNKRISLNKIRARGFDV